MYIREELRPRGVRSSNLSPEMDNPPHVVFQILEQISKHILGAYQRNCDDQCTDSHSGVYLHFPDVAYDVLRYGGPMMGTVLATQKFIDYVEGIIEKEGDVDDDVPHFVIIVGIDRDIVVVSHDVLNGVMDCVVCKVSPSMNSKLLGPFHNQDIKKALFQMHP
ncbi:hypothetical protein POM88_000105 [Heracleum sosnowskyi]|uniref:Uncharacterized protein n=1 Tax=Heracleum sosnowskyi TaxID=360622 RepID=A0AAD8N3P1_9APIA|nr:hypothetical protein POM88_000105 [Heracleum sosnowskyi]